MAKKKSEQEQQIKVTLVRSYFNADKKQQAVLESLGLRKIRQVKIHKANPAILGMIAKVSHMVTVENV